MSYHASPHKGFKEESRDLVMVPEPEAVLKVSGVEGECSVLRRNLHSVSASGSLTS